MSYAGHNYDIVSGISAGALGWWLVRRHVPRWVVASWNALGFVLLVNIVTIAIVSTPVFGWFGNERLNTFVTYPPFVWLPGSPGHGGTDGPHARLATAVRRACG